MSPTRTKPRPWTAGDAVVTLYYGPSKQKVGQVRIRGITGKTKKSLIRPPLDACSRYRCTVEEYSFLCGLAGSTNVRFDNGFLQGYNDPQDNQELYRGDSRWTVILECLLARGVGGGGGAI